MTDPAQPQQPQQPQAAAPLTEAEDKQWASFAHLGNILGPLPSLIIWLVFKDRGAKTNVEAKEALNWAITAIIALIATGILQAVFAAIPVVGWIIALLIGLVWWAVLLVNLIFAIMGFSKVNGGGSYRYPFALRFIK